MEHKDAQWHEEPTAFYLLARVRKDYSYTKV
jgi:hypothetical protein